MTDAKNGRPKKDRLDRIEEVLRMAAVQTAENTKQIAKMRVEFNREMKQSRAEMKEIRALFKDMIRRIAY